MSLMKACKNRRKGAGNSNPNKRHAFPDIDQNALDESLDLYVRTVGQTESFNLYSYKTLQAQMAESPQSFYKLHGLLDALIGVERSGCIKYKYLKSALALCKGGLAQTCSTGGRPNAKRTCLAKLQTPSWSS